MNHTRFNRAIWNHRNKLIERIKAQDPALGSGLELIKLDWYRLRNAAGDEDSDTAELFIYDEIGGLCGVQADDLVQEIENVTAPNLHVRINSPGGSLFDSIAIYNALVKKSSRQCNVVTYVDALAASGASIIAMAGDTCVMMVGSQLMIHDAIGLEYGNAKVFREMADFLDKQSDNIATIYEAKGGEDAGFWRNLMLAETWMFAQEAVDLRLADSVFIRPSPDIEEISGEDMDPALPDESDEEDMPEVDEEAELEALMLKPHRLHNRGFKYRGRRHAPTPSLSDREWFSPAELAELL